MALVDDSLMSSGLQVCANLQSTTTETAICSNSRDLFILKGKKQEDLMENLQAELRNLPYRGKERIPLGI